MTPTTSRRSALVLLALGCAACRTTDTSAPAPSAEQGNAPSAAASARDGESAAAPTSAPQRADDARESSPAPGAARADERAAAPATERVAFDVRVPGTTVALHLVPIPGGTLERDDPAHAGARERVEVAPFFLSSCEVTWDMYDAYLFALDRAEGQEDPPDAFTRPSKPYILMDRGFGHSGYPAISVSFHAAQEFCAWLSETSGHEFRLPTEAEWEHAARGGATTAAELDARAWHAGNSEVEMRLTTHPVGTKQTDALGLHDVLGNASEWAVGPAGAGFVRGGSFRDAASALTPAARRANDPAWNRSDPQVPKSVWWLADGGFVGFRVVCDPAARPGTR